MKEECFCLVELPSYVGMMELIDNMMKAAEVELVWYKKIGGGMMTACFRGGLGATAIVADKARSFSKEKGLELREVVLSRPDTVIAKFLEN